MAEMDQVTRFRTIGPTTYLCPIPAVMLGCANPEDGAPNLITVAWTGVLQAAHALRQHTQKPAES